MRSPGNGETQNDDGQDEQLLLLVLESETAGGSQNGCRKNSANKGNGLSEKSEQVFPPAAGFCSRQRGKN
ncbi:MAG: hypothetical protein IPI11_14800 [Haliscomenobacter sp.]|nr:hypothetical protein [Haliscomenobacter sp.]